MKYFLSGIAGSGMRPLALLLNKTGNAVAGSDRHFDRAADPSVARLREQFGLMGIGLFPQDGSGVRAGTDALVVSTAIERDNPDLLAARTLNVPVRHRADVLAQLANAKRCIGVSGTSGKTTVTGMITHVLRESGLDPSFMLGDSLLSADEPAGVFGGAGVGAGEHFVVETDESDGSLVQFRPWVGVLTNISKDHKEVSELLNLFMRFAANCRRCLVVNADDEWTRTLSFGSIKLKTFGVREQADFQALRCRCADAGSSFEVDGQAVALQVPGMHNVYNALAAFAACSAATDLEPVQIARALGTFRGVRRRLERVSGRGCPVSVFDDFAHNPQKISASLSTLTARPGRVFVVYQPHGYKPLQFMKDEFIQAFSSGLRQNDSLLLLDIYDAGGTADRSISSGVLAQAIGPRCRHARNRGEVVETLVREAASGDAVVVMGARDPSLSDLAREIAGLLASRPVTAGPPAAP